MSHWRRVADEGKPYPYARFNKSVKVPTYTKEEYEVSPLIPVIISSDCPPPS